MDDLRPIRIFLEVAQQQSFAGAARSFNITPSSVTREVAKLEDALGRQLLLRTTRKVSLTSFGATVAARYRPLLEELDITTQRITRESRPDSGRLRINAPMSMGLRLLPGLFDSFRLAYPNVSLVADMSDRLVDIMEEPFDLAVRISRPPQDVSTIWRKICLVPRFLVASPALLERMDPPDSPGALDPAMCLSYGFDQSPEQWVLSKGPLKRTVRAGTGIITNNGDMLYELTKRGQGIALLPEFIVADGLARGDVVKILEDWTVDPLWLTLFYPPYDQFPPLVATFTEFFEDYIKTFMPDAFIWS